MTSTAPEWTSKKQLFLHKCLVNILLIFLQEWLYQLRWSRSKTLDHRALGRGFFSDLTLGRLSSRISHVPMTGTPVIMHQSCTDDWDACHHASVMSRRLGRLSSRISHVPTIGTPVITHQPCPDDWDASHHESAMSWRLGRLSSRISHVPTTGTPVITHQPCPDD